MTRAQLRKLSRQKLGDLATLPANQKYGDADYNVALLHSAYIVQGRLAKVNAVPFTRVQRAQLTAAVEDYALPSDWTTPGVRRVYVRTASGTYLPYQNVSLEKWEDDKRRAANGGVELVGTDPGASPRPYGYYTQDGDYLLLDPTPATTDGVGVYSLRLRYAAVVTMPAEDSVPQLPLVLHDAIWLITVAKLAPQQDEALVKTAQGQADQIIGTFIEAFRNRFGNEPEQIESVGGVDKQNWKSGDATRGYVSGRERI